MQCRLLHTKFSLDEQQSNNTKCCTKSVVAWNLWIVPSDSMLIIVGKTLICKVTLPY